MMICVGMISDIVSVDPDGKYVDITMQRFLKANTCEYVFMTHLGGEHNMFKVLLDNQATLHVFKNKAY